MGYVLENSTIRPSEEKTKAVEQFPIPKDRRAVQRFLVLTSYFRRFIPDYALIAKPLSDLLKKNAKFKMGDDQILAFQQLKVALVGASVLRLFNPNAETEIHTDASKYGYGAVLLQKDSEDQQMHPIQYMSRKTTPAEEKYHSYELEVLAIIEALKKWRVYVMGIRVKIVTDCNAFTMTMKKQDVPLRVSRWALFLQDFDYVIEHRSGSKMRHVDALSRVSCLIMEDSLRHRIKEAQLKDDWVKVIHQILLTQTYEDFYLKYDIVHKNPAKELVVIPSSMEPEIIEMAHRQGHFGVKKTSDLIERDFYIPGLHAKVENIVRSCIECIMTASKTGKQEGLLNPIDKGDRPLKTYHLDHVGPMETTKKQYNHILVVVDAFSKFAWLYPTKSTGSGEVIDRLQKQAAIFGNPARIITDRGSAFTSHEFGDYCTKEGIQHLLIATGVPRGNGQVERIHRIVIPMLTKLSIENPQNWYRHVDKVQRTINNTPSRSTGSTPFEIMTGLKMRTKDDVNIRELLEDEAICELNQERDALRDEARENILKIQQENKKSFDRCRKPERKYSENDLVAIKRTQFGTGLKLKPKFLGPYKIVKVLNHGRYNVEKVGECEGSRRCTTVAEYMKPWGSAFGANANSGRPNVGSVPEGLRRSARLNGLSDN